MSAPPSASLHNVLNVFLAAAVVAVCGLYLQLRAEFSELQTSCVPMSARQAGHDGEHSVSCCALACSDFCRNLARTEHIQAPLHTSVQSAAAAAAALGPHMNHQETAIRTTKLTPENILSSYPAAFKTSESSLTVRSFSKASVMFGESHDFSPRGSSSISSSALDLPVQTSGLQVTSSLNSRFEEDILVKNSFLISDHLVHSKATSLGFTGKEPRNNVYIGVELNTDISKLSQTTMRGEGVGTISPTCTTHHEGVEQQTSHSLLVSSTAFPLLQTSSVAMSIELEAAGEHEFSYNQQLDNTRGTLADTAQVNEISVIEDSTFSPDSSCEMENCQAKYPLNHLAVDWDADAYDEEHDEDDDDDEDEDEDEDEGAAGETTPESDLSLLSPEPQRTAGDADLDRLSSQGTLMKCEQLDQSEFCRFKNLCYSTKERDFVFLVGDKSDKEHSLDQLQHFSLNLSAVPDHNAHSYPLVLIPAVSVRLLSVAVVPEAAFIMSRFKPDNLMHVFHDDLLPLVHTLLQFRLLEQHDRSDLRLVMADSFDPSDNLHLYASIFSHAPLWLFNRNSVTDLICFKDSYTGLSTATIWYQYGFFVPQGSVSNNISQVMGNLRRAVGYIADIFHTPCLFCGKGSYLVLLSRKDNRLITNEGELVLGLVRAANMKVLSVSVETHSIGEIISILRNSRGLVGMHGSLLIFGIFLPPRSVFIELYPYGVNPSRYTPYKTFCDFSNSGIVYKSWSNTDRSKTIGHPNRPPELGGIHHLSPGLQAEILEQTDVPEHLCCEDPSWLYHIYQDTQVDVDAVVAMTTIALTQTASVKVADDQNNSSHEVGPSTADQPHPSKVYDGLSDGELGEQLDGNHLYFGKNRQNDKQKVAVTILPPSRVCELSCELSTISFGSDSITSDSHQPVYTVKWLPPWSLKFLQFSKLTYEIVHQREGAAVGVNAQVSSDVLRYVIRPEIVNTKHYVWVRAVVDNNIAGPYRFISCQTPSPTT
ncbi:protein O-linked-mannose beta-1,4-N-acetylglucosaminyltransferase 2 [Elysia marginata]|uniref:Protein O-linked-mannose beta-1,4-N-acetylglucosaminyltransferase 2 n=1 Tax=Elysia marginata TaxID=1093978 RepID=A0AAV4JNM9_9GAST|nr:protein O-linked-mannose beta-1,4-N-acetylglucosaminyltransferase 2 [Elysia marginata]